MAETAAETAQTATRDAAVAQSSDVTDTSTPRRPPKLTSLILVDAAAALAGLSVWAAADMWYTATGLGIAAIVAVGDALFWMGVFVFVNVVM